MFSCGAGVSKPWGPGPGAWFLTDLGNGIVIQLSQTAEPEDYVYIYSVACEVWLWVSDVMFLWWFYCCLTSHLKLIIKLHKLHYKCNLWGLRLGVMHTSMCSRDLPEAFGPWAYISGKSLVFMLQPLHIPLDTLDQMNCWRISIFIVRD